jgi:hypothetical protein
MNENSKGFDLRAMIDNIGETLRSAGTAASDSLRPAMMWTESGLRNAVLTALGSGPMTGHDVIESIHASNEWGIKPASAKVVFSKSFMRHRESASAPGGVVWPDFLACLD